MHDQRNGFFVVNLDGDLEIGPIFHLIFNQFGKVNKPWCNRGTDPFVRGFWLLLFFIQLINKFYLKVIKYTNRRSFLSLPIIILHEQRNPGSLLSIVHSHRPYNGIFRELSPCLFHHARLKQ